MFYVLKRQVCLEIYTLMIFFYYILTSKILFPINKIYTTITENSIHKIDACMYQLSWVPIWYVGRHEWSFLKDLSYFNISITKYMLHFQIKFYMIMVMYLYPSFTNIQSCTLVIAMLVTQYGSLYNVPLHLKKKMIYFYNNWNDDL